jgi:hypothetical protein
MVPPGFVSVWFGRSVKGFRCAPIALRRLCYAPPPLTLTPTGILAPEKCCA